MFTYTNQTKGNRCKIAVRLEGKLIGHIRGGLNGTGGFRYHPKGSRLSGDEFSSIEKVKRSIEHGDD